MFLTMENCDICVFSDISLTKHMYLNNLLKYTLKTHIIQFHLFTKTDERNHLHYNILWVWGLVDVSIWKAAFLVNTAYCNNVITEKQAKKNAFLSQYEVCFKDMCFYKYRYHHRTMM